MTTEKITSWLNSQLSSKFASGFIMHYNGSISASLLFNIAKKTGKNLICISTSNNKFSQENSLKYIPNLNDDSLYYELLKLSNDKLALSYYSFAEINYIRPWKHFTLMADLLPFGNMNKTDIDNLFAANSNLDLDSSKELFENNPTRESIYSEKLNITFEELEWARNIDKIHSGIISKLTNPLNHPKWYSFTIRQKTVIGLLNKLTQSTNYKLSNPEIY